MYSYRRNIDIDTGYIMDSKKAFEITEKKGTDIYIGVPDSLLQGFIERINKSAAKHMIAVNEAHAVAIAFGLILGGRKPCVYLQNSGLGNIINPLTSLCLPSNICPFLVIGHRHTLPQHKIMGEADEKILKLIGYRNYVIVTGDNNVK